MRIWGADMPKFKPGTPSHCPGSEAFECETTIYRACDTNPPTEEDFISHSHSQQTRKKQRAVDSKCLSWGLSVWVSEEDARHARELHDWLKRKFLVRCNVSQVDGQIAQTGHAPHHTFWPYDDVDLLNRASLVAA
jgi:hypothetical protein